MFGFPEYGAPTVFMWSLSLGHATGPVVEEDRTIQSPSALWVVLLADPGAVGRGLLEFQQPPDDRQSSPVAGGTRGVATSLAA
jgi:hypothetical protein